MDEQVSPLITALINSGGMGLLAAVLFHLLKDLANRFEKVHSNIIDTFKAEQKAEREMCDRHFLQLTSAIDGTHKVLSEQTEVIKSQQRLLDEHHRLAMKIEQDLNRHRS